MINRLVGIIGSLIIIITLAGCGASTTTATTDTIEPAVETVVLDETATVENQITGDPNASDAFVVWGWNTDIEKILELFYQDYPEYKDRIVFVNSGGEDNYQTKIDEQLQDSTGELYPDVMGLEVDYVLKYVNGDNLMNITDLGITTEDTANMYEYNLDLGTDAQGNTKALFWQATPGSWQLRADLCEKYLGTTDPQVLQEEYFETWEKVISTAQEIYKESDGNCRILSGYTDIFRVFSNSRTDGWYDDNNKIVIDSEMSTYMETAKILYQGELTFDADLWSVEWYGYMDGDGTTTPAALAYPGCPWFTYWCLSSMWNSNTILIPGPQQFYWGGTGLAATKECSDPVLASLLIKYITCSSDAMVKINEMNSDFVNNKVALSRIIEAEMGTCPFVYGEQNFLEFYLPLADKINSSTATAEDQIIHELFADQVKEYVMGNKDSETALYDFKKEVHKIYGYLLIK